MRTIAIIGGGFAGIMTAVNLMKGADFPLCITIINTHFPLVKGIAYSTHYPGHLLNVPVESISAFDEPADHFLKWLSNHPDFAGTAIDELKPMFAPRMVYAEYLNDIWANALANKSDKVKLTLIEDEVTDVTNQADGLTLSLRTSAAIQANYVVLATGNAIPKNPPMADPEFYNSKAYFKNPWGEECLQNLKSEHDLLLIGNSLTMIDTVIALLANGFSKKIYTVSPHGFAIMADEHVEPYAHNVLAEIPRPYQLYDLVKVINKHMKRCKHEGINRLAVINSIRHNLQQIWGDFSIADKRYFLKRIAPMWNAWRHRTPAGMYQKISGLINTGKLIPITGRVLRLTEKGDVVEAVLFNKNIQQEVVLAVERVINCTGSQIDLQVPGLLNTLYKSGLITADPLNIALNANAASGAVIDSNGNVSNTIFTLGNNMKGILWETTGVPEIRAQAEGIAKTLIERILTEPIVV